jgi:hypothetical protein
MIRTISIFAILVCSAATGWACSFDTDCAPGSEYLKTSGSIYGVCAGGIFPGNANDRQPVYAPMDLNHTCGNTRSFDIDCDVDGH